MTEFEAALEFVREYSQSVAVAVRRNRRLEDWFEYQRYCEDRGLQPTRERLSLVQDIAIVAREYFVGTGSEHRLLIADAGNDPSDLNEVPPMFVLDSRECLGWRANYLKRSVGFARNAGD